MSSCKATNAKAQGALAMRNFELDRKTYRWAVVGGVAAIVAALLTFGSLLVQMSQG